MLVRFATFPALKVGRLMAILMSKPKYSYGSDMNVSMGSGDYHVWYLNIHRLLFMFRTQEIVND
jgi:hypothetical protein